MTRCLTAHDMADLFIVMLWIVWKGRFQTPYLDVNSNYTQKYMTRCLTALIYLS